LDAWCVELLRYEAFRKNYPMLALPNVLGFPNNSDTATDSFLEATKSAAENEALLELRTGVVRLVDHE
jgi:hypothetical protein